RVAARLRLVRRRLRQRQALRAVRYRAATAPKGAPRRARPRRRARARSLERDVSTKREGRVHLLRARWWQVVELEGEGGLQRERSDELHAERGVRDQVEVRRCDHVWEQVDCLSERHVLDWGIAEVRAHP